MQAFIDGSQSISLHYRRVIFRDFDNSNSRYANKYGLIFWASRDTRVLECTRKLFWKIATAHVQRALIPQQSRLPVSGSEVAGSTTNMIKIGNRRVY